LSSYAIIVAAGSKIRQNKVPNRRLSAHPENRAGTHKEVYMRSLFRQITTITSKAKKIFHAYSPCASP
jgi:hypothetical protein